LNELYRQWSITELDKKSRSGEYVLGNKEIKCIDNEMHIEDDDGLYSITLRFIELFLSKSPVAEKYSHEDLSTYI